MSGDDEIRGTQMITKVLAAAPMPFAEVPAQSKSVEEVLRDEPAVNLGSDHDEYPEMELNEEEEVDSKEAEVEQEIGIKDGDNGRAVIEESQASVEVQELRNKVFLLEELWKGERALRELIEERNDLKAQVNRMKVDCSVSSEAISKKKKKGNNNKRKRNNDSDKNSGNSHPKKKQACVKCGKNHLGECMKGKNVCYNCGQQGHISPNCSKPKKGGCFSCGGKGHRFKNCPKKKTGEGSGRKKE